MVRKGVKKITITPDTSTLVETLDFEKEMINPGARHLVLAGEILRGRAVLARNTVLLTAPRFLNLSKKPIKVATKRLDDETISVTVSSAVYHHRVELSLPGGWREAVTAPRQGLGSRGRPSICRALGLSSW